MHFLGIRVLFIDIAALHQYEAFLRATESDSRYFQNYQMSQERFQTCESHKTAFIFADGILECTSGPQIKHANLFIQSAEIRDLTRKPINDGMDYTK